MKHRNRYSWVTDKYAQNVTYDYPKQREYQELCSIANDKDNYSLSEISNDPQFIANASLKGNTLTEVKNACELLCENAIIRSITIVADD